jgi:hypothetical protein
MTINAKLPDYLSYSDKLTATALVRECLQRGYSLSVHDGEEWTVKQSRDENAICGALGTTEVEPSRYGNLTAARLDGSTSFGAMAGAN